jgi:hypothetical protein
MHPVEVLVTGPEAQQDGVAEFRAGGRTFAFTILEEDELGLRLVAPAQDEPLVVGAHSLMKALEHARELLS